MANTSISDFKSKLVGGGARANLFQVTVNFPSLAGGNNELASFLITAASLPASLIASITIPFRGRQLHVAGDRTFEPWNITVINDNSFSIRNAFERWMNAINSHAANTGLTDVSSYSSDMYVDQLDKAGNIIQTYVMRACFPTAISAIDLSAANENTIEQFTVELQVLYWENRVTTT